MRSNHSFAKSTIVLNQDQEAAAEAIFRFLMSSEKELSISGPAGTGKTTLMHYVMTQTMRNYERACSLLGVKASQFELVLAATTNKACEVLTTATGFPAQTIHSYLGLKVFPDFKTGISKISMGRDFKVHFNKLIFIDEASMVDKNLYGFIHKGTDSSCKIIYLGDRCQMAPVFEKISPVYAQIATMTELSIPMRNANQPALMALCNQLRRNVDTKEFLPIAAVPGVIDYVDDTQASAAIQALFAAENSAARILAYTNDRVAEYNGHIRLMRGYPGHPVPGESLVCGQATQLTPNCLLRVEEEFIVHSCDTSPETLIVAENAELDVFNVEIQNDTRGRLKVRLPTAPGHFKDLMAYYAKTKQWAIYYRLKNSFPDLRPKDASTVYKAQGSTYDTVFIDLVNIGRCTDEDQVARMLYVAASRATNRILFYGELPVRFNKTTNGMRSLVQV